MEVVERLIKKVQRAADDLVELKKQNRVLQSEVDLLQRQLKDHQNLLRDNERHRRTFEKLKGRLTKLQKKVERAMFIAPVGESEEANGHEERPQ